MEAQESTLSSCPEKKGFFFQMQTVKAVAAFPERSQKASQKTGRAPKLSIFADGEQTIGHFNKTVFTSTAARDMRS